MNSTTGNLTTSPIQTIAPLSSSLSAENIIFISSGAVVFSCSLVIIGLVLHRRKNERAQSSKGENNIETFASIKFKNTLIKFMVLIKKQRSGINRECVLIEDPLLLLLTVIVPLQTTEGVAQRDPPVLGQTLSRSAQLLTLSHTACKY
jgi:hypothetical protein